MNSKNLHAEDLGIATSYEGVGGTSSKAPQATVDLLVRSLLGETVGKEADLSSPPVFPQATEARCFFPSKLKDSKLWGISLQMYEVRSRRSWGIGDFSDIEAACAIAARNGADFLGLSPLHALFAADPERCSPYSPSSRIFLNPLFIAPDKVKGFTLVSEEEEARKKLNALPDVDYAAVAELKFKVLRRLWQFTLQSEDPEFLAFRRDNGSTLSRHALFEALSAEMVKKGFGAGWRSWPVEFQDHRSQAVLAFAGDFAEEVRFHEWVQWLASRQLLEAKQSAKRAGMQLGLYLDFAVGLAPDGSETWSGDSRFVDGFVIGAPPDPFTTEGQNWGLAVPKPPVDKVGTLSGIVKELTPSLSFGGMIRLDHIMGLWQLFVIPEDLPPSAGTYLRYPLDQVLDQLAEISCEQEVIVIGEDLGNVPPGFRELMQQAQVLSYRLLYFEAVEDGQVMLNDIPPLSLFCLSTHDLMPLAGWWQEEDIPKRVELGLVDRASADKEQVERKARKSAIAAAVGISQEGSQQEFSLSLARAIHDAAAEVPSALFAVRLADLLMEREPTNIPGIGTESEYRNWRRKVAHDIEAWEGVESFTSICAAVTKRRPKRDG